MKSMQKYINKLFGNVFVEMNTHGRYGHELINGTP